MYSCDYLLFVDLTAPRSLAEHGKRSECIRAFSLHFLGSQDLATVPSGRYVDDG